MNKNIKIGLLDYGIGGMYAINALNKMLKGVDIIYVSEDNSVNFEGLEEEQISEDINKRIKKKLSFLLSEEISLLVVVNDTIIEYCLDQLNELSIPYVNMVTCIIDYVNKYYEYKNVGFLALQSVIEANIYQKNFKYNHLYNLVADDLYTCLCNNKVKTSNTFSQVRQLLIPFSKRDIDIIVPTIINAILLTTEIKEYTKRVDIIPVDVIIASAVEKEISKNEVLEKGKNKIIVYLKGVLKKDEINKYIHSRYKLLKKEFVDKQIERLENN